MEQPQNDSVKRLIIAGGGTGGHIFPAVAIANAIKKMKPGTEILFIGAKGKMEMEKVPQAGYRIEGLDIAGFNRSSLIKNATLPFKIVRSFMQVKKIFGDFKPAAAIGVGGYSSFPVLRYAQAKGIPTFIHESNSFAGKSNILLGKKATEIFTAAPAMEKFFPVTKTVRTGNPVRNTIEDSKLDRNAGVDFFEMDPAKKTVLIIGGSLGAKSINTAIAAHLDDLGNMQLIWQTGKPFYERAKEMTAGRKNIFTAEFITSMEYAYAAADIVVSRSGAMAVAELSIAAKPVIFVPYPHAAEDHQTANAKMLADAGAALIMKDDAVIDALVPALLKLSEDSTQQNEMKINIAKFAVKNAADVIAKRIIDRISN